MWMRIAAVADCPPGEAREIVAADRIIALFNVDGSFYSLDGICPHQGGPLGKGVLRGCVVTCPWHGWQFDVRTGRSLFGTRVAQPAFEVRIEGRDVLVAVP